VTIEDKRRGQRRRLTVREQLDGTTHSLTPAEAKVAQVLLADYPLSGLGSVAGLAKRARVSDPTVVRFAAKLGFAHFSEFQASLLEEVEARLRSPLMMVESKLPKESGPSVVKSYLASVTALTAATAESAVGSIYERAVDMILQARQVGVLGGRFSRNVAEMLASYLVQFRRGIVPMSQLSIEAFDRLIDFSRRDLLIVFDYRRYQTDVVSFARQAAERDVRIILFTDPWLSPISEVADLTITCPVEVASPYDSLVGAVAQMETLVAQLVSTSSDATSRMEELEVVRTRNRASLTNGEPPARPRGRARSRKGAAE
jgi:DNA-binding MurR/RpiR family transcriptional regulator